jgi:hypothetical protein
MQRTNIEAYNTLKIIGGKVGRWSVANRDYRKIFYDFGHLFDLYIFSHGYIDEDERIEKELKEKKEDDESDGTKVIVKREKKYEARKPFVRCIQKSLSLSLFSLLSLSLSLSLSRSLAVYVVVYNYIF